MSKLLDMLRKSEGDIADLVAPLVAGESRRTPQPSPGFESESSPPAPLSAAAAAAPPAGDPSPLARVRSVSLRVPAPSPLLPFEDSHREPSEQYRILRTRIGHHPAQPQLIVVTSPDPGDGKSVTVINTAAALALKSESRVLLLDADLRKPAIHLQLGLPQSPGLADVLAGACAPEEALVRTQEFPNLYVMPSGSPPSNPAEFLDSTAWRSVCAYLRGLFRHVVIDSPPAGGLADYKLIEALSDGVILVLRPDYTHRASCWNALESVPKEKFLGVLLNCVPKWPLGRHPGFGYYYDYYSSEKR